MLGTNKVLGTIESIVRGYAYTMPHQMKCIGNYMRGRRESCQVFKTRSNFKRIAMR